MAEKNFKYVTVGGGVSAFTTGDTPPYTLASTFQDLNLPPDLLRGLHVDMKFHKPNNMQAISLPMILTSPYKNLVAQAHNGSGKTTCFVLGMLSRVDPNVKAPQALCICPTRELAIQNLEVLQKMGKHTRITSQCAIPMDSTNYMSISKRPPVTVQIVIGTPGTIKKWMSAKKLGVSSVKVLVFDEADHMLAEDGFKDDSLRIMKDIQRMSDHCQVLLFSATFNESVKNFVSRVANDHNQLFVKKEELSLELVKQYKVNCPDELSKVLVIKDSIFKLGENFVQKVIFVHTRNSASMLHKSLVKLGYEVTTIQGALKQEVRDKIVKEFEDGLTQVLISNDFLARGFDQRQVNLVINYDLPVKLENHSEPDCEIYLHRIGKAGRVGRKGVFSLLMSERDQKLMEMIEWHFNSQITQVASWSSAENSTCAVSATPLLSSSPTSSRPVFLDSFVASSSTPSPGTGVVPRSQPPATTPPLAITGLPSHSSTSPPAKIAARPSLGEMLTRAAKAKASSVQILRPVAKVAATKPAPVASPSPPPTVIVKRQARVEKEKSAAPIDLSSGSGSRDFSQEEIVVKFIAACQGGGLQSMSSLPTDILATKGASLLAEGFKFALVMGQHVKALNEANLALQAELEEARNDLTRAEESITSLVQSATEAESSRQAALVDLERMRRAYDTATLKSTRRWAEREIVKAEKVVLLDENRFLQGSLSILESKVDSSFIDGYFTASYEVAQALPPTFDLQVAFNWDRDQIMAKAAQLLDADQDQDDPTQAAAVPDPSSHQPASGLGETTEVETQDPPSAQENLGQDSVHPTKAADSPVEAGVPRVGEVQDAVGAKVVEEVDGAG